MGRTVEFHWGQAHIRLHQCWAEILFLVVKGSFGQIQSTPSHCEHSLPASCWARTSLSGVRKPSLPKLYENYCLVMAQPHPAPGTWDCQVHRAVAAQLAWCPSSKSVVERCIAVSEPPTLPFLSSQQLLRAYLTEAGVQCAVCRSCILSSYSDKDTKPS